VIGFLKQIVVGNKPKVSRGEVLGARPVRHPGVEWERGRVDLEQPPTVLLRVPRRSDRWGEFVARIFRLPSHRKIELDEMGSDVWEMCDGTLTVDALTRAVCAKYHLNRRQGEASVTAYMRMLAERRLLALKVDRRQRNAAASEESVKRRRGKHERTGRAPSRR
jgi:hypothetical protein